MGSLPSKRKQIANQISPQLNTRHSQSDSIKLPVANSLMIVAVSDFPSRDTEPVLRMGEQLSLLSEEGEWCQVKSVATGKECCVPSNNIAKISHRWLYDGIDRAKAEELLLLPANQEGSFIIRKRQAKKGCYSLSIRCTNHESWNCVKHYRINCLENNWLYISPSLTFSSLHELVDYYSESCDGLCCCLKKPCFIQGASSSWFHNPPKPVEVKKSALNWQQIKRLFYFLYSTYIQSLSMEPVPDAQRVGGATALHWFYINLKTIHETSCFFATPESLAVTNINHCSKEVLHLLLQGKTPCHSQKQTFQCTEEEYADSCLPVLISIMHYLKQNKNKSHSSSFNNVAQKCFLLSSSDFLSEEPLTEDSPISLGLREAVTTYLFMTDDLSLQGTPNRKQRQTKDI